MWLEDSQFSNKISKISSETKARWKICMKDIDIVNTEMSALKKVMQLMINITVY